MYSSSQPTCLYCSRSFPNFIVGFVGEGGEADGDERARF